mgnify:CR=1 FL=1
MKFKPLMLILISLCVILICSCATTSIKNSSLQVIGSASQTANFYPDILPSKSLVNQKQEWQLLTTIYGGKQFEGPKKGGFWKAVDSILGQPTELRPYINLPLSVAIAPQGGKFFVLDGYPPQKVQELGLDGGGQYIVPRIVWIGDTSSGKLVLERKMRDDFEGSYDLIAGPDSYLYMAFPKHKKIKIFNQSLELIKIMETPFEPWSIEISNGKIYVTDQTLTQGVFVLDMNGKVLKTIGVEKEVWEKFLENQDEKVFNNPKKRFLTSTPQIVTDHKGKKEGKISFYEPSDIAVSNQGDIYVAEYEGGRILRFSADGKFISQYGRWGPDAVNFSQVNAVAVDKEGRIYGLESGLRLYKEALKLALPIKVFHDERSPKIADCPDYFPYALWGGKTIEKISVPNTNNLFEFLKKGSDRGNFKEKIVEEIEIPDMANPLRIVIDYNAKNIAYFQQFATPNFKIDYLLWICSHSGALEMLDNNFIYHGKIAVFGCGEVK